MTKKNIFSSQEKFAINEKFEQLKMVKNNKISHQQLAELISQRRLKWVKENLSAMLIKYRELSPEEQAYRIIYFDHMKINPHHSKMIRLTPKKIQINSYNFCPYLEACGKLNLKTKHICKHVGEPSIIKMIKKIHPNLKFSRNYNKIRPHGGDYCEEYIELID